MVENVEAQPIPLLLPDISIAEVKDSFIKTEEVTFSNKNLILGEVWKILNFFCPNVGGSSMSINVPSETLIKLGLVSGNAEEEIKNRLERKRLRKQKHTEDQQKENQPKKDSSEDQTDKTQNTNDSDNDPQNIISFRRTESNQITISKTYVSEELTTYVPEEVITHIVDVLTRYVPEELKTSVAGETKTYISEKLPKFSVRKDIIMEEETVLTESMGTYEITMRLKEGGLHMHDDDERVWIPKFVEDTGSSQSKDVPLTARNLNRTLALIVEGLKPGCLGNQRLF